MKITNIGRILGFVGFIIVAITTAISDAEYWQCILTSSALGIFIMILGSAYENE
jgi:hypothetical protein